MSFGEFTVIHNAVDVGHVLRITKLSDLVRVSCTSIVNASVRSQGCRLSLLNNPTLQAHQTKPKWCCVVGVFCVLDGSKSIYLILLT